MSPLPKLPDVVVPFGLEIRGTDADMKQLAGFRNLAKLNLDGSVTAAGLKELAGLVKLAELRLGEEQVTAAGLKELAEFKGLRSLSLSSLQPTDAAITELVRLTHLEELELNGTSLHATDIKGLAALNRLSTLRLHTVSDRDLEVLRDVGLLYALANAAGKDGARPKSADEVSSFDVTGDMTPAGLKTLRTFKNLRSLRFYGREFTDAWLKEVVRFENLAALDLGCTFRQNLSPWRSLNEEV